MYVLITGIAGVLGSSLAEFFLKKGFEVKGNDIVRPDEAWRLAEIKDEIEYIWKSTLDLKKEDLNDVDIIFDCSIGFAERSFGNFNPLTVAVENILPSLHLLEVVRHMKDKPIVIYPSSFNSLYGYEPGKVLTENLVPLPSTVYGWTKASVEQLYYVYNKAYGVKTIVTRVGSAYGEKMRSDELIARLIISGLRKRKCYLFGTEAKRLWTYKGDVLRFYEKLIEKIDECVGKTFICAGNKNDEITTNLETALRVKKYLPDLEWEVLGYEEGEVINGKPIDFKINAEWTREFLKWKPKYTLDEGIERTIAWIRENIWRYC